MTYDPNNDDHVARNRVYQAEWYKKNREKHYARIKEREANLKAWFNEYKKTLVCERCPEDHPACLDFHHKDPAQKDRNLGQAIEAGWGKKRILEEIEKCEVLCSNCHRKLHWQERQ